MDRRKTMISEYLARQLFSLALKISPLLRAEALCALNRSTEGCILPEYDPNKSWIERSIF